MKRLNVLVVDDDPSIRMLLRIAFTVEEGFGEVREAADGAEAVRVCGEFRPDVVLLDFWMPAMDGDTAAARIKELHPSARIVAFSGVIEGKPEWADDFVVKGRVPGLDSLIKYARGAA
jgi:chemotaxis response regulator CheB